MPDLIVSYGGGVNSAAMLVALRNANERPAAVVFADTGGERPETYKSVEMVSAHIQTWGWEPILTIRRPGETLEENCLRYERLPSKAYGFGTCSIKWKRDPFRRWLKENGYKNRCSALPEIFPNEPTVVCMGFDAHEDRRVRQPEAGAGYVHRFPLIELDWDRDDCKSVCEQEFGFVPPKSACFFCPNSRRQEIHDLAATHPELMQRALNMEANARLTSHRGLGRSVSWADVLKKGCAPATTDTDCFCNAD